MRRVILLWMTVLPLALGAAQIRAADSDLVVAVPKQSPATRLSATEISNIFLSRHLSQRKDLRRFKPFDRENADAKALFYREVASISLIRLRAYWAKKVFTGRDKPPEILDREALARRFADTPNAISYFLSDNLPPGARVVYPITVPAEGDRQ